MKPSNSQLKPIPGSALRVEEIRKMIQQNKRNTENTVAETKHRKNPRTKNAVAETKQYRRRNQTLKILSQKQSEKPIHCKQRIKLYVPHCFQRKETRENTVVLFNLQTVSDPTKLFL